MSTADTFAGKRGLGSEFDRSHHLVPTLRKSGPIPLSPPLIFFHGRIPAGASDLPPLEDVQLGPGVHTNPCSLGALCPAVERPACKTDHSPPSHADLKDMSSCTYSNPSFARIKCGETTSICMQKPAPTCQIHTHLTGSNMRSAASLPFPACSIYNSALGSVSS